ncbi:MarR family transcriptional regulator [Flavicella sp.]|uniref:MarR family winged helix-turn-helix transcriptional regulator n=1 Tax=Flavicella sp. TaxID=2957742 RepID=UPI0026226A75|nr:MarR family transcriptional regulator [Flavicella sp.]MDG1806139.1 MarR family transcriptional regulator [Flavicella sp.]MDG2280596.1 MarR family transcriptional regulator [Flavicella sp.]
MGDLAKDINSTFPSEHVKAIINIKYTANWIENKSNHVLKPFKISVQQYNILRILRGAKEKVTVQTVKDRMIEKSPNTTRLMDKLCAKNLMERVRCENDRRVVYVQIASLGLKMLEEINMDGVGETMNRLTEEEAIQLNALLDKIR